MLCIDARKIVANTISSKPVVVPERFNLVKITCNTVREMRAQHNLFLAMPQIIHPFNSMTPVKPGKRLYRDIEGLTEIIIDFMFNMY